MYVRLAVVVYRQRVLSVIIMPPAGGLHVCHRLDVMCRAVLRQTCSTLAGLPAGQISRLQSVLSAATRLVLGLPGRAPVSAAMHDTLHWLPIQQRIEFKVAVLAFDCVRGTCRSYFYAAFAPHSLKLVEE